MVFQKFSYKALCFVIIIALFIFVLTIHTYDYKFFYPDYSSFTAINSSIDNTDSITDYIINSNISVSNTELYIIDWKRTNDISCHYKTSNDSLPLLPTDFNPPPKSIFLHETSCRGGINSRQACAIESAARAHPNWNIYLLFLGPVTKYILEKSSLAILLRYKNVKLYRIHIHDYAKGTPIESYYATKSNPISNSTFRVEHTSDSLRFLSLYKFGGVYMDTDVVVMKSFDTLADDWSARESDHAIDAGVMAFSRGPLGRKMAEATIQDFKRNYNPKQWGNNGPGVITRVVKNMCVRKKAKWISGCDGFVVYDPIVFYPVYYPDNKKYFEANRTLNTSNKTYAHHMWNALTRDYKVPATSPYAKLAKQYCPKVYTMHGDKFGV